MFSKTALLKSIEIVYVFSRELNKSSQHRGKLESLLLIPVFIFKVIMSCVLGCNFFILTRNLVFLFCPRTDDLDIKNFLLLKLSFPRNLFHASHPEENW